MVQALERDKRTEQLRSATPNNFVVFLDSNLETISGFGNAMRDLKVLEGEQKKSPELEELVIRYMNLRLEPDKDHPGKLVFSRQKRERWKEDISNSFLKDTDSEELKNVLAEFKMRFPFRAGEADTLIDDVANLRQTFKGVKKPLADAASQNRKTLFANLSDYLVEKDRNLLDLADFLTLPEYLVKRQDTRMFLRALAEHVGKAKKDKTDSMFAKTGNEWVKKLTQEPMGEVLVEFLPQSLTDQELAQWLSFGLAVAAKINPNFEVTDQEIVKYLPSIGQWPNTLKNKFIAFLTHKFNIPVSTIHKALEQYEKNEDFNTTTVVFDAGIIEEGKANGKSETSKVISLEEKVVTTEKEKVVHGVSIFIPVPADGTRRAEAKEISDSELEALIAKDAKRLAKNDYKRMGADLTAIVADLRVRPAGKGVEPVTNQKINVEFKDFPLQRLSPRQRGKLDSGHRQQHPHVKELRIVFAIDNRDAENPRIIIEGIYKHSDFIKKFAGRNE